MRALVLTLIAGCATTSGGQNIRCSSAEPGSCEKELLYGAIGLAVVVAAAGTYYAVTHHERAPAPPSPPAPRLLGQVRSDRSAVSALTVTLRRTDDPVVRVATTDRDGRFRFEFPRKPGWYTFSVHANGAEGQTVVWLQDRRPGDVEILLRRP